MKTENVIGLIGLVAVIGLVAFYYARYDSDIRTAPGTTVTNVNGTTVLTNTSGAVTGISLADVATHSTTADCWIVVSGMVYNVTNYLIQHPGGAGQITPYCGQDATTAFQTKGGQGTHSTNASQILQGLYVGVVAENQAVQGNANANVSVVTNTNTSSVLTTNTSTTNSPSIILTTATIAKHSTASDCWIIVSSNVYAVSGYLAKHPGGAGQITPYCGKDATAAFATQGGTGSHSSNASADLAALRLGTLGSNTTTKTITQVNANVGTLTPQNNEREDEDD